MVALANRVHIFAPPGVRDELAAFFADALGCAVSDIAVPGKAVPFLLIRYENGAAMTVEFVDDALSQESARHGAYLELEVDDPEAMKERVLAAGAVEVPYSGTPYFYFQPPGGQVFRLAPRAQG